MNEFRETLAAKCKPILAAEKTCASEEATKQFMVLPFLRALGYDPFDPSEVVPEHHADFSEKYKNRVDYAICRDGVPMIAIEVKCPGNGLKDARGQLRAYFNACPTVKLGILANGVRYECFADTDDPNMMDEHPFLAFDLNEIVSGKVEKRILHGIADLRRDQFDPANIGAEARRKLLASAFVTSLAAWQSTPSDGLVRLLLDEAGYKGSKTQKVIEESRDLAVQAFASFVEKAILLRMGIQPPVIEKVREEVEKADPAPAEQTPGIVTTATELAVFDYTRRRLAYLLPDEIHFKAIDEVSFQDMKTTFRVFYRRPVAGILFNYRETSDGTMKFTFPALEDREIVTEDLPDIDDALKDAFAAQVAAGG